MLSEPVKRKRSVTDIRELYPPAKILSLAKRAYEEPYINDSDRLEHAALICTLYMGGFRINEALDLMKHQFKRRVSLEKRDFIVIEAVSIEKSGGRMRNSPIYPKDPLSVPIQAHLNALGDDGLLFHLVDRTALRIADRISDGVAWNHWFREQRNTFLAAAFTRDERKKIFGWSGGQKGSRDMADMYEFMNWMSYADRLAKLSESYWENEPLEESTKAWLSSLGSTTTTT